MTLERIHAHVSHPYFHGNKSHKKKHYQVSMVTIYRLICVNHVYLMQNTTFMPLKPHPVASVICLLLNFNSYISLWFIYICTNDNVSEIWEYKGQHFASGRFDSSTAPKFLFTLWGELVNVKMQQMFHTISNCQKACVVNVFA